MKTSSLMIAAAGVAVGVGLSLAALFVMESGNVVPPSSETDNRRVLYWVAPMDPNYRRAEPGKSPMGMDLVPVYEGDVSAAGDGGTDVFISPVMIQNLGVRTAPVERRYLSRTIRSVGYVAPDDNLISHVHVRAEGWIEELAVKAVGERVREAQPLFGYYAPDIHVALGELAQFQRRDEKDMLAVTLSRLALLDVPANEIEAIRNGEPVPRRTSILSPASGVIISMNVGEGMFVKPDMTAMTVAELSSVWVMIDIFENQTPWIREGQPASLRLTYLSEVMREGVVDYVYPTLDPKTRTLKARLRFDNPDGLLKPNMFADVRIQAEAGRNSLVVPSEALIRTGLSDRVVVSLGDGRYRSREVVTGQESDDFVEILEGVNPEDRIVVSGQFLIDSESNLAAAFQRMELPADDGDTSSVQEGRR